MTCPSTCKPVIPANRQSELTPAYQIPLVMQNGRMRQMNAGEQVSPEFLGDVATFDSQGRLLGAGGVVLDVAAAQALAVGGWNRLAPRMSRFVRGLRNHSAVLNIIGDSTGNEDTEVFTASLPSALGLRGLGWLSSTGVMTMRRAFTVPRQ